MGVQPFVANGPGNYNQAMFMQGMREQRTHKPSSHRPHSTLYHSLTPWLPSMIESIHCMHLSGLAHVLAHTACNCLVVNYQCELCSLPHCLTSPFLGFLAALAPCC
jgi:hypothetical protein